MRREKRKAQFNRWLEQHGGIFTSTAAAFALNAAEHDDLVQEMMIALWHALDAFREQAQPSTYMYRIAQNAALMWRRSQARHNPAQHSHQAVAHLPDTTRGPAEQAQRAQINQSLRQLDPVDRVLMLMYLDGHSYQEIAEVTGMTDSHVGVRLHRARTQLKQLTTETTP